MARTYISGRPGANLSDDTADRVMRIMKTACTFSGDLGQIFSMISRRAHRVMRFEIGFRLSGLYRIIISMHEKTSDPNTPLHCLVLADLWAEEIRVCFSTPLTDIC